MKNSIETFADKLLKAELDVLPIEPLTDTCQSIDADNAYQIQLLNIRRKLETGDKITGKKIGLTSLAMQRMLGVETPDYGILLESMLAEKEISTEKLIQPKIEAEIAFVLKKDLPKSKVTVTEVLMATDYVVPALEIIDSRIRDWEVKLEDTVADNASSAYYVLGDKKTQIDGISLEKIGMLLKKNGQIETTGAGAAVMGHPAVCVAWLANKLSEYGISLNAGEVILSGSLAEAVTVSEGDFYEADFSELGKVQVQFIK